MKTTIDFRPTPHSIFLVLCLATSLLSCGIRADERSFDEGKRRYEEKAALQEKERAKRLDRLEQRDSTAIRWSAHSCKFSTCLDDFIRGKKVVAFDVYEILDLTRNDSVEFLLVRAFNKSSNDILKPTETALITITIDSAFDFEVDSSFVAKASEIHPSGIDIREMNLWQPSTESGKQPILLATIKEFTRNIVSSTGKDDEGDMQVQKYWIEFRIQANLIGVVD